MHKHTDEHKRVVHWCLEAEHKVVRFWLINSTSLRILCKVFFSPLDKWISYQTCLQAVMDVLAFVDLINTLDCTNWPWNLFLYSEENTPLYGRMYGLYWRNGVGFSWCWFKFVISVWFLQPTTGIQVFLRERASSFTEYKSCFTIFTTETTIYISISFASIKQYSDRIINQEKKKNFFGQS